jgi:hypothetical protein
MKPSLTKKRRNRRKRSFKGGNVFEKMICLDKESEGFKTRLKRKFFKTKKQDQCYNEAKFKELCNELKLNQMQSRSSVNRPDACKMFDVDTKLRVQKEKKLYMPMSQTSLFIDEPKSIYE